MKIIPYSSLKQSVLIGSLAVFGLLISPQMHAATVSGGALIINLNRDALIAGSTLDTYPDQPTAEFPICCRPSVYLEEFFDANSARFKTFDQIREDNTPDLYDLVSDEISATGLNFAVNGSSVTPVPPGRENRATDFNFNPNDIFGTATGSIGLGGVMRFRVDVDPPSNRIMLGDLTMEYLPEFEGATPGRSGWVITNHIGFDAGGFELFDVTTQIIGNSLMINGNLGFGEGFDHLSAYDARLNDTRIGTFSFQTNFTPVPLPSAIWLFGAGFTWLFASNRSKRKSLS